MGSTGLGDQGGFSGGIFPLPGGGGASSMPSGDNRVHDNLDGLVTTAEMELCDLLADCAYIHVFASIVCGVGRITMVPIFR